METQLRMEGLKENEEEQFTALADLLDAELEYYTACKDLVEQLRANFPDKGSAPSRPRAKSNASARTAGRTPTRTGAARRDTSEESPTGERRAALRAEAAEEENVGRKRSGSKTENLSGRDRSDSAASAGKGKRFMTSIGSIGSFGVKSSLAAASAGSKMASKAGKSAKGGFGKTKYGNLSDEERRGVTLDSDDESFTRSPSLASRPSVSSRARSQSVISVVSGLAPADAQTTRRRALTSPPSPSGQCVKVLFDYKAQHGDELSLEVGQIVEVKHEVSEEWLSGECEGFSGIFPKAYTEPYVPPTTDTVAARLLPPRPGFDRRSSSPAVSRPLPSDTESEAGIDHDHHDHDNAATSLWSAQAPPTSSATKGRSRAGSLQKKAAPPPPPSRRTTSSNNILSTAAGRPVAPRSRSSTVSRVAGGEDISGASTPPRASPHVSGPGSPFKGARSPFEHSDDEDSLSLSHGMGALHVK